MAIFVVLCNQQMQSLYLLGLMLSQLRIYRKSMENGKIGPSRKNEQNTFYSLPSQRRLEVFMIEKRPIATLENIRLIEHLITKLENFQIPSKHFRVFAS